MGARLRLGPQVQPLRQAIRLTCLDLELSQPLR
jgi:hypothetical protein